MPFTAQMKLDKSVQVTGPVCWSKSVDIGDDNQGGSMCMIGATITIAMTNVAAVFAHNPTHSLEAVCIAYHG